MPFTLCVVGPPAADAGVVGRLLASKLRAPLLTLSNLVKTESINRTHVGRQLEQAMEATRGAPLPSPLVAPLVLQSLSRVQRTEPRVVLAEFPRSHAEWQPLRIGGHAPRLLHLRLAEERQRHRLASRQVCAACGLPMYLPERDDPRLPLTSDCDCDQPRPVRDVADDGDAVRIRQQHYESETLPLVDSLRKNNALMEVDVQEALESTWKLVQECLPEARDPA